MRLTLAALAASIALHALALPLPSTQGKSATIIRQTSVLGGDDSKGGVSRASSRSGGTPEPPNLKGKRRAPDTRSYLKRPPTKQRNVLIEDTSILEKREDNSDPKVTGKDKRKAGDNGSDTEEQQLPTTKRNIAREVAGEGSASGSQHGDGSNVTGCAKKPKDKAGEVPSTSGQGSASVTKGGSPEVKQDGASSAGTETDWDKIEQTVRDKELPKMSEFSNGDPDLPGLLKSLTLSNGERLSA